MHKPQATHITVGYVTAQLPYGTDEAFIIPELVELMRQGHSIVLVPRSPSGRLVHGDAAALLPCSLVQPLVSLTVVAGAIGELVRRPGPALSALSRLLRGRSPAIVLKNLAVYPKGLWLARVARRRGFDHIHCHWATTTSTMAMVASEVSGIPWSLTAHRADIVEDNLLAVKLEHVSLARFISTSGVEMARARGANDALRKARVLHMGVDVPAPTSGVPRAADPRVILCPARLVPVKGHRHLLDAIALLTRDGCELSLWFAGDGELRDELERQVDALGIRERVRFLGQVSHADLLRLYQEGRIGSVVLPSLDLGHNLHEGIPVALIEAMGHGVPVISTTTGGIPELLDGGAGILVPPADPGALAGAIDLLVRDPGARERYAAAGRRRVAEQFAVHAVVLELAPAFARAA